MSAFTTWMTPEQLVNWLAKKFRIRAKEWGKIDYGYYSVQDNGEVHLTTPEGKRSVFLNPKYHSPLHLEWHNDGWGVYEEPKEEGFIPDAKMVRAAGKKLAEDVDNLICACIPGWDKQ